MIKKFIPNSYFKGNLNMKITVDASFASALAKYGPPS
jgi:hypothetical protein